MVIDPKTGKKLITPDEAAEIYGCTPAYFRRLYQDGEIGRVEESPRRIYYDLDEVVALSRKKAEARKKRGGRPRKGGHAA